MSDDTEDFDKGDETDKVVDDNQSVGLFKGMFIFGGQSSTIAMRDTGSPHPLDWVKNCVATKTITNSKGDDITHFLVIVEDTFEWRDITECLPSTSEKEYVKKVELKRVH